MLPRAPPCGRKRDEEGVPLGVDLDAAGRSASIPNDPPVLRECGRISLDAQLAEKPRRARDVGEEQCDGAGREIRSHET